MTLTVADIGRWDAGDVREVFHAATSRAQAAFDAADGLAELPAFETWGGEAADAAREAIGRTRVDLDAHGREALAVADAARRAADSIDGLKGDLAQLKSDAASWGLEVDPSTNSIVPIPGSHHSRRLLQQAIPPLQARVNSIVDQANSVDLALAAAIHLADGSAPLAPSLHADDAAVQQALAGPLPEDPKAFHDLWQQLSFDDRDLLYSRDHTIGNHPGMPTGDNDMNPGSDYYNRLHLADELAASRASHADTVPDLEAIKSALDEARKDGADARLMLLDTTSGERVHAAIAVGDPDTADHVSVTTPGLNTTVRGAIGSMTAEAASLQRETQRQLVAAGKPRDTAAAIAWIGYDAPQIPGPDAKVGGLGVPLVPGLPLTFNPLDVFRSEVGAWQVSHDAVARAGAVDLARFYDGITAARDGAPAHLTAIGHSYGSLTTGLALQVPGDHGVSDAIFYGSPGIEASTPAQLNLPAGHVFTMETPDDPIDYVYTAPPVLHTAATVTPMPFDDLLVSASDASGTGHFGPNPATNPNFTRLETGPMTMLDGHGGVALHLDGASGHSDYPRPGTTVMPDDTPLPRTTGYNIAAVVAGLDPITGD